MPAPVRTLTTEYLERLRHYGQVDLVEVAEEKRLPKANPADRELALVREAERIRRHLPAGVPVAALDRTGRQFASPELAEWAAGIRQEGMREVVLLIGGPDGLHDSLLQTVKWRISFGPMTFPHLLMRVLLLEQLYRAMTILHGEPYHR